MYTLEYLPIARRDMVDIAKYIGVKLEAPDAAERLAEEISQTDCSEVYYVLLDQ